ncbi:hypothetical protein ES703_79620 [subsurface metagenome]
MNMLKLIKMAHLLVGQANFYLKSEDPKTAYAQLSELREMLIKELPAIKLRIDPGPSPAQGIRP